MRRLARTPTSSSRPSARALGLGLVAGILAAQIAAAPMASAAGFETEDAMVPSGSGTDAVELDTRLYIPDAATAEDPAPAVMVAHGYGGTKNAVSGVAERLADEGYVVMTWTARGFGDSTGQISANAPDFEVADARTLIDVLAARPEVKLDAPGDPLLGIYGRSYGGALSLLAAGYDDRIDTVVAGTTWNNLVTSLFPNDAGPPVAQTPAAGSAVSDDGVFKRLWVDQLLVGGGGALPGPDTAGSCGNYRQDLCDAIFATAESGRLTPELADLLTASSPASVVDRITVPTLLTQGEADTLFTLEESDATMRVLADNGTTVKLAWYAGGHGARTTRADTREQLTMTSAWLGYYLRGEGDEPDTNFGYSLFDTATDGNTSPAVTLEEVTDYPGLAGNATTARVEIPLEGDGQEVLSPAGGSPAAVSAIPPGLQLDEGSERNSETPMDIDGQTAVFDTPAFEEDTTVLGSPSISVQVASTSGEAVLFGKLYDVDAQGNDTLILGLVSPFRLTGLGPDVDAAEPVEVTLPALAQNVAAGHHLRVALASTDQAYGNPVAEEATYQVALADPVLSLPSLEGGSVISPGGGGGNDGGGRNWLPIALVVALLAVAAAAVVISTRRRTGRSS